MTNNKQQTTNYHFEFRLYRRSFARSLTTSHGKWDVREGIILRLEAETGQIGWGEIAPLSWFGSESLAQAWEFCQALPTQIAATDIFSIPAERPACQFGFETAWEAFFSGGAGGQGSGGESSQSKILYSYLLPTGEAALQAWQTLWEQGSRTFKWKIGVAPIDDEFKIFNQLIQALPPTAQLRLDANGGLSQPEAHQWLRVADEAGMVEFLEQPLPPEAFDTLLAMSDHYATPIALDESVATLDQLQRCYKQGWRGVFVVKPSIAGSPKRLREFCHAHPIDVVFSSVFESAIARQAALQLALELSPSNRAVGFGVNHWFNEDDDTWLKQLWTDH